MVPSSRQESEGSDDSNSAPPRRKDGHTEAALLLNRQRAVEVHRDEVKDFLHQLSSQLSSSCFSICLLSDRAIRRYNKRFRHRDESTDVLSFPAEEVANGKPGYLGDILISAETARDNAQRYGHRIEEEIKLLALHGLLHLLGYDHESDDGRMARSEGLWSAKLGLPQNLTERPREPLAERIGWRAKRR